MKKCRSCYDIKDFNEYYGDLLSFPFKLDSVCKSCRKIRSSRDYYEKVKSKNFLKKIKRYRKWDEPSAIYSIIQSSSYSSWRKDCSAYKYLMRKGIPFKHYFKFKKIKTGLEEILSSKTMSTQIPDNLFLAISNLLDEIFLVNFK